MTDQHQVKLLLITDFNRRQHKCFCTHRKPTEAQQGHASVTQRGCKVTVQTTAPQIPLWFHQESKIQKYSLICSTGVRT